MKIKRTINIIICGTCFGNWYIQAVKNKNIILKGVIARGSESSKRIANQNHVPLYTNINDVPWEEIDLAVIAIKSLVSGGNGGKIAEKIMLKGVSVLQEQPVHYTEVEHLINVARENKCCYLVNNFYKYFPAIKKFKSFLKKLDTYKIVRISMDCSFQVLYPLLDILSMIMGGLKTITIDNFHIGEVRICSGNIKEIPYLLNIYHEYNSDNLDDSMRFFFKISIETTAGNLVLFDPHGPIIWQQHFLMIFDQWHRTDYENMQYVRERPIEILYNVTNENYKDIFYKIWMNSMVESIEFFFDLVQNKDGYLIAMERTLECCVIWNKFGKKIRLPRKICEPYQKAVSFKIQ